MDKTMPLIITLVCAIVCTSALPERPEIPSDIVPQGDFAESEVFYKQLPAAPSLDTIVMDAIADKAATAPASTPVVQQQLMASVPAATGTVSAAPVEPCETECKGCDCNAECDGPDGEPADKAKCTTCVTASAGKCGACFKCHEDQVTTDPAAESAAAATAAAIPGDPKPVDASVVQGVTAAAKLSGEARKADSEVVIRQKELEAAKAKKLKANQAENKAQAKKAKLLAKENQKAAGVAAKNAHLRASAAAQSSADAETVAAKHFTATAEARAREAKAIGDLVKDDKKDQKKIQLETTAENKIIAKNMKSVTEAEGNLKSGISNLDSAKKGYQAVTATLEAAKNAFAKAKNKLSKALDILTKDKSKLVAAKDTHATSLKDLENLNKLMNVAVDSESKHSQQNAKAAKEASGAAQYAAKALRSAKVDSERAQTETKKAEDKDLPSMA